LKRILFALELGGNWGHLGRDLPIATALREGGFQVRFAAREGSATGQLVAGQRFEFSHIQTAMPHPRLQFPAGNYAEVLLSEGYGRAETLSELLKKWREQFESFDPDVIVADYAPAALLAARVAARPLVCLGLGFELPPPTRPLPSIRPWESIPAQRLLASEQRLLETFNAVLREAGAEPLRELRELFLALPILLTTMPELDHYGPRPGGLYLGPIYSAPSPAVTAHWPSGAGPRVLAYLTADTLGLPELLAVLNELSTAIVCVPNAATKYTQASGPCVVYSDAVVLDPLLPEAQLLITNGNLTTSTRGLLAGVPVLALPHVVEQQLGAMRIESLGAGQMLVGDRSATMLRTTLQRLLEQPSYAHGAHRFAARYARETNQASIARVCARIEARCRSTGP
jgi:UDP:flavonoid glycosyltransferase YjiC (YdhE family)